jgi:CRISPR/Cas system-associated exonuclease Cas4 (RecB family)
MPQLTTLSQSSLQDYHDCPRRFELRYMQRLAYPAVEAEPALENEKHQQEGEYFHRLAQQYFVGIPVERIAKLANTDNLQRWWENFVNDKDLSSLQNLTGLMAEASLSAPLGKFRLLAKYDLIAGDQDKVTIYDWKTYRKRPKNEWMLIRWQTRVYRALLARTKSIAPEQIEMVYWYADFPAEPARFPYSADQFKRDWDALEKIAAEILSAGSFPLTEESARCNYCPYRSYCDRGIRAGDASDAELESAAEELFNINFEQVGEIAF